MSRLFLAFLACIVAVSAFKMGKLNKLEILLLRCGFVQKYENININQSSYTKLNLFTRCGAVLLLVTYLVLANLNILYSTLNLPSTPCGIVRTPATFLGSRFGGVSRNMALNMASGSTATPSKRHGAPARARRVAKRASDRVAATAAAAAAAAEEAAAAAAAAAPAEGA